MDIASLMAQFGGFGWMIAAFVVALSVIVAVHEYGHYIIGRWSGIHADVFSIGFGPVLWSGTDKRGTQWQFAALPFGGYVKFAGDANAASGKDEDAMAEAVSDPVALRRTMHGAPLWARAATVVAGPMFNFIFSAAIFIGVLMWSGTPRDPVTVGKLHPMPAAVEILPGDVIVAIGDQALPTLADADLLAIAGTLPRENTVPYTVNRDGTELTLDGPFPLPARVGRVTPRSAGLAAGLEKGDVITHVDGREIVAFGQLQEAVLTAKGDPITLTVWREGDSFDARMAAKRVDEPGPDGGFETFWRIGVGSSLPFEYAKEPLDPATAIPAGFRQVGRIIEGSISGLSHMILGKISTCNLSGPIGIAQTSGAMASAGLEDFIWFIAVLSTAVGLLNLFPVPALDGGHLVFYAYEAVTGKPPSDGALRVLMTFGLALVLSLMVFALFNDVFCP